MNEHKKPRDEALSNFSNLKEQAKLLAILCISSPSILVNTKLQQLLSNQPSIFTLLQQPFLKEIRQQLIAIATSKQHTSLLASLSQHSEAATPDFFPKRQRQEFIDSFLRPLQAFTHTIVDKLREATEKQDSKTVGHLLPLLDNNQLQAIGHQLLFRSTQLRCVPIVSLLAPLLKFDHPAASNDTENTVLHYAVVDHLTEITQILLQQPHFRARIPLKGNTAKYTPLHYAAQSNYLSVMPLLLPVSDVNARSIQGVTPLFMAVEHGHIEIVRQLLAAPYHADIMLSLQPDDCNSLHLAADLGLTDIVQLFLPKLSPAKITKPRKDGLTALSLAALGLHQETTQLLLPHFSTEHKIMVFQNLTLGSLDSFSQDQDSGQNLIRFNIILCVVNSMQKIPAKLEKTCMDILYIAILSDQFDLIDLLAKKLPKKALLTMLPQKTILSLLAKHFHIGGMPTIHFAAFQGKTKALQLLTASFTTEEINHELPGQLSTPLHLAIQNNNIETITFLLAKLDSAVSVKLLVNGATSPLHTACFVNNLVVVELLLTRLTPEQINTANQHGETPLDFAINKQYSAIARLLLSRLKPQQVFDHFKNSINNINCPRCSDRHTAASFSKHVKQLKFLLSCSNDNKSLVEHLQPLYIAILDMALDKDLSELVDLVIDKIPLEKLSSNISYVSNWPTLHFAAYSGRTAILQRIITELSPEQISYKPPTINVTPLYLAAENGHLPIVEILLAKTGDQDVMTTDEEGFSALHIAIYNKHLAVSQVLIDRLKEIPAALSLRHPPYNESPLLLAAKNASCDIAGLLLAHLKNPDEIHAANYENDTPLHFAAENGDLELVKLLLVDGSLAKHINHVNNEGYTPLMTAIIEGETAIAELLIDQIANAEELNLRGKYGSPLELAIDADNIKIISKLTQIPGLLDLAEPFIADTALRNCTAATLTTSAAVIYQRLAEQKKSKPTRFSFERRWEALAESSQPLAKHSKRSGRKERHKVSMFKPLPEDLTTLPTSSSMTSRPQSGLDSKAAFHQAMSLPLLPNTELLAANHYYPVNFARGQKKMLIHLSDAVVEQAQDQGVWEDLQEFLKRPAGIHFVGQDRDVQGLKKLRHISSIFPLWELTIRSKVLGDVRLFTTFDTKPTTQAVTPEGETVSIIQLKHLGSHADLRPQSASSSR